MDEEFWVNYELVLGMKVKTCVNPHRWGARMDLDFPRIYVWIETISIEVNVTLFKL